ncbi:Uncharacterized protein Adt_03857 [Abeliophyllum distichum]|uniref:Uncharacterized protein n=1 Tax=Abeliophyllum distichum TaxID=126358 RepID=A0ABD1VZN8_9LAMI
MRTRKLTLVKPALPARKNGKWTEREHQIFVTACKTVIVEGHRRGKCFSKHNFCSNSFVMLLGFVMMRLEKAEYTKFRNCDVCEIYHRYPLLFGQAFDLDKYAMTPTKLLQCGFDGVINSGSDSLHGMLPPVMKVRLNWDQVREWISLVVTVERSGKD